MRHHEAQTGARVQGPFVTDPETQDRSEQDGTFLEDGTILGTVQSSAGILVIVRETNGVATALVPIGEVVDDWDLVEALGTPATAQAREQEESELSRRERDLERRERAFQKQQDQAAQAPSDSSPTDPNPNPNPER